MRKKLEVQGEGGVIWVNLGYNGQFSECKNLSNLLISHL